MRQFASEQTKAQKNQSESNDFGWVIVVLVVCWFMHGQMKKNEVTNTSFSGGYHQIAEDATLVSQLSISDNHSRNDGYYYAAPEPDLADSGEEAGFEWAQEHGSDCDTASESFNRGCEKAAMQDELQTRVDDLMDNDNSLSVEDAEQQAKDEIGY